MSTTAPHSPNIVIALADDMGFSDIGCFGSEIRTPALDALASSGVRFSQFYNCARCCPTRASLLTGVQPHQAGVGHMVQDYGAPGYRGFLGSDVVTIAEVLRSAGYATVLSGKWHVGGEYGMGRAEQEAVMGDPTHPTPTQRGFEQFYGMLGGAGSYFRPPSLCDGESLIEPPSPEYYFTDAVSERAITQIDHARGQGRPFFLYLAYTAPHWPLHALPEDIAEYEARYRDGWDAVRTARHEALVGSGIIDRSWTISPRDPDSYPFDHSANPEWESLRMAVYAAQVQRMDRGIGAVVEKLRAVGELDNTLFIFLSDNGGCAEFLREDSETDRWPGFYAVPTIDGRPVTVGNIHGLRPGGDQTFMSYDLPWANASNAPFRLFKHWVHEGGIATPFIMHWPDGLGRTTGGAVTHSPAHVVDIMATCLEAAGVEYPDSYRGNQIQPSAGESFLQPARDAIADEAGPGTAGSWHRDRPLFWEHEGNRAIRHGTWKLVSRHPGRWELYNMEEDRTELHDRAAGERDHVQQMIGEYEAWAASSRVLPWPASRHAQA